jgi:antitoxin (DNA-binding transcriptional repressor) of toxin-antitoxin stability system
MKTVPLDEALSRLPELVNSVVSGEGLVVITRDDRPVALLTSAMQPQHSILNITPSSVGALLQPSSGDDDLLEQMTGG